MQCITLSLQLPDPSGPGCLYSFEWPRIDEMIVAPRFYNFHQFKVVLNPQISVTMETFEMVKDMLFKMMPAAAIRGVLAMEMGGT